MALKYFLFPLLRFLVAPYMLPAGKCLNSLTRVQAVPCDGDTDFLVI